MKKQSRKEDAMWSEYDGIRQLTTEYGKTEQILAEKWNQIGITNDFLFCKIMEDENLLAELIRRVLPDLKFSRLEITTQKSEEDGLDTHGIRFDVFSQDSDGHVIDVEMQVSEEKNLGKRSRFYISMNDMQILEKGKSYNSLKDTYVIIICPFDPYGYEYYMYTFMTICRENPQIKFDDGMMRIILNAKGRVGEISTELKNLLDYVAGKPASDEYTRRLDDAVHKARRNKEWRRIFMTLAMKEIVTREKAIEEGIEIGISKRDREKISEMLANGKTPEAIAEFCNYPMSLIKEVQQNMLVTD